MIIYYQVYVNESKIFECKNRHEAHDFVKGKYNELMPFLEYEPLGDGSLETWTNGHLCIDIIRMKKGKTDILKLLENHNHEEVKERKPAEVNVAKNTPCTPTRTRIYDKDKKLEKAADGKKKTDKNGNVWISKKMKDGTYKWTRFYEENYENKRKSPKFPAKDYDEGTVKKGMDGKMWEVRILSSGNKKWFRK